VSSLPFYRVGRGAGWPDGEGDQATGGGSRLGRKGEGERWGAAGPETGNSK
jgi:hypothetical protein